MKEEAEDVKQEPEEVEEVEGGRSSPPAEAASPRSSSG